MLANFYKVGKIPVFVIFLKILLSGRVIISPQSSIIQPEMLSGPCALLTFL